MRMVFTYTEIVMKSEQEEGHSHLIVREYMEGKKMHEFKKVSAAVIASILLVSACGCGKKDGDKKSGAKKIYPKAWKGALQSMLDGYFGKCPEEFEYKGVRYTPQSFVKDIKLGESDKDKVKAAVLPLLKDATIFGVDLEKIGLSDRVIDYFMELIAGTGAVRKTLQKYC